MLSGWNTWDAYSVSSIIHAETGLRLRFGVLDGSSGVRRMEFLLPDITPGPKLIGPRTADGSYIEWRVEQDDFRVLLEFSAAGDSLVWRITPERCAGTVVPCLDISYCWGTPDRVTRRDRCWHAGGFSICPLTPFSSESAEDFIILDPAARALVTAERGGVTPISDRDAQEALDRARSVCVSNELQSEGFLRSAAQGLSRGAFWDTIWEPVRNRPLPIFSRQWCVNFGGFVDAPADNFAQAASTSHFHERLACLNIEEMIAEANPDGMLPNIGAANGTSHDRSEPPNGSHSALKIYRNFGDKAFLERVYPGLARWNRWWYSHRDGNGDGLFEWGADPVTDPNSRYYGVPGKRRAMWELCADNSVLYQDVDYNEQSHTLEMSDVGLNAYLALDAWSLREIALILGNDDEAAEFDRKYSDLADKINDELWNEEHGIYLDKHWDGRWCEMYEPQLFFPMIAGIAPPERARRMVDSYLLNEARFWGEFPLPSISRDNPAFRENDYYRGRIWGEQVHLVIEGLHRCGMYEEAYELSRRVLEMYLREWEQHSHSHENYNSVTGEGDDVRNATCDYAALGGIMSFVAIQQLVDVEAWGGVRFGNLSRDYAKVSNVIIGGKRHNVETGGGLTVWREGEKTIESDAPVVVGGLPSPSLQTDRITLRLRSTQEGTLRLLAVDDRREVIVEEGGCIEARERTTVTVRLGSSISRKSNGQPGC